MPAVNLHAHFLYPYAGKTYDVELDFEYFRSDAQLNFDLGFKNEVDVRKSVERVKDADIVVFVGGVSLFPTKKRKHHLASILNSPTRMKVLMPVIIKYA